VHLVDSTGELSRQAVQVSRNTWQKRITYLNEGGELATTHAPGDIEALTLAILHLDAQPLGIIGINCGAERIGLSAFNERPPPSK
jgi:hypothetical protein